MTEQMCIVHHDEVEEGDEPISVPLGMQTAELKMGTVMEQWFRDHGDKISGENHFLRINPVRLFWSKERTRYECTADLMLCAEAAQGTDKVIVRHAIDFALEWPNA